MANPLRNKLNQHANRSGRAYIEARVTDLNAIYSNARESLEKNLISFVTSGKKSFTGRHLVALTEEIQQVFPKLEEAYREKAGQSIHYLVQSYYRSALNDLSMDDVPLGGFNKAQMQLAMDDMYTHIAGATRNMDEMAVKALRRISAQVIRESALTGETQAQVSKRLFLANGGTNFIFTDAKGATWNGEAYFDMLSRTTLNNSSRESYLQACADQGSDIVSVSFSGKPCPACAKWEGRLLSISGKTKGLPSLADAIVGGLFHPNCTHHLVAVPPEIAEEYYTPEGRPKTGLNSPGNEERDDKDAWREYRKRQNQSTPKRTEKQPRNRSVFTPAQTREEALEYTKSHIADNVLLPKNTPLDVLNAVNEHIGRNIKELGFKPFLAIKEVAAENAIASMTANNVAIGINRRIWREISQHPQRMFDQNVTMQKEHNGIRYLAVDKPENFLRHVVDHEFGHAVYNRSNLANKDALVQRIFESSTKNGTINLISGYAKERGSEFFAESFAMYRRGDKLPKEITGMIKEVMK